MDCSRTSTRDPKTWLDLAPEYSQAMARQVRLYYWKQWKRPRTRRRNLITPLLPGWWSLVMV